MVFSIFSDYISKKIMIYIFEDRTERKQRNESKLKEYGDVCKFAKYDELIKDGSIENFAVSLSPERDCVIFHRSYALQNGVSIDQIRTYFIQFGIPFVEYSGGIERSNAVREQGIKYYIINADLMYSNLPAFLDWYKKYNRVVCDVLIWGNDFEKNRMFSLFAQFYADNFLDKRWTDEVPKTDISRLVRIINRHLGNECAVDVLSKPAPTWYNIFEIVQNYINQ